MYGKKVRGCVLLGIGRPERKIQNTRAGAVNVIKAQRQKDICMG